MTFLGKCTLPRIGNVILLACLLLTSLGFQANAQQSGPVSGVVVSQSDGEPLVGVVVQVQGSHTAVITGERGSYSINVARGGTLVFSHFGYQTLEVPVTGNVVDVEMTEDINVLDAVVKVGYGSMRRSDLTGAVTSVTSEDIGRSVNISLDQALQGRAAGVTVTQNSGAPGGGVSVSIRGVNTFNGNEPLYVIDGIPISGNTSGNTSALANINPSDILSMEVLKDASATAIYGTRAANGVVLITTRQGESGKTKISYDGYYGLQQLPNQLEVLNLREYAVYQNLRAEVIGFGAREEFADPSMLGEGTNWQKELFRTASMHSHQLTLSGGNEHSRFAIMAGYLKQNGIAIGSGFDRYSLRLNFDNQVARWLNVGVNSYVAGRTQTNTIDNSGIIPTAIRQLPEVPVRNPDGSFGIQQENMYGTYFHNPVADALNNENYNRSTDIQVRGFADITIIKGLVFRAEASTNIYYNTDYRYTPLMDYEYVKQASSSNRGASNGNSMNFNTYLTYNKSLGRHNISLMAGHESQENRNENLSGSREGFIFNSVHELDAGDAKTAKNNSNRGSSAIESYYGRLNYNFDDRYLLTATLRRDGSSSFAKQNRWGTFPSVAVAWRINNESFLKDVRVINNLKLRLGWGIVGNQSVWGYAYGVTMSSSPTPSGQGFFPGNFSNPNLKWERTNSYNLGLDLNMFNNRVELILDLYKKNVDNLLMQASLPNYVTAVIGTPWVNAGAMTNKGIEVTLNTVNIDTGAFSWRTGITLSRNVNKVTALYSESAALLGTGGGATTNTIVGGPVGRLYGYKITGMFMDESDFYKKDSSGNNIVDELGNPVLVAVPDGVPISPNGVWVGDFIFEDRDGNGVIDQEDRSFIGNADPKFTFGINNTFAYKGFDLNIFINGVYGNTIYNSLRQDYTDPMSNSGLLKEATRIAVIGMKDPEGDIADLSNAYVVNKDASVQRIWVTDANDNNRMSDRFVEDGSYLRIKNIALGYTFPKRWVPMIDNLRLYVNIQNAFTFTKYSGFDPEVGSYNVLLRNIDNARYPSQRIYTFGMNFTF